jgi:hypothetical protein
VLNASDQFTDGWKVSDALRLHVSSSECVGSPFSMHIRILFEFDDHVVIHAPLWTRNLVPISKYVDHNRGDSGECKGDGDDPL